MKQIILLISLISFALCNICYSAEIPKGTLTKEQLSLGYFSTGANPKDVTQVYGQPDRIDERNGMTYYYGQSLIFKFMGEGDSWLYDITTTDNNGVKTADGIEVGMMVSKLYDIYGTPNFTRKDKDATRYWYYWEKSNFVYFTFTVKNGKIIQISLHNAD